MKVNRNLIYDILIICALIFLAACLLIYPADTVNAASGAVETCLYVVIPSLFPFFVLATLSSRLGLGVRLGESLKFVMKPVFGLSGACALPLVLGLIGGYPVGARAASELYTSGGCTKEEAERLLAFCNNSGPAFIFGIAGSFIFGSVAAGAIIYAIHILSSLAIGAAFKYLKKPENTISVKSTALSRKGKAFHSDFIFSVSSSILSMVNISGFIIFFTVFVKVLSLTGISQALCSFLRTLLPFLSDSAAMSTVTGLFEMTSGICSLKGTLSSPAMTAAVASFLLGWAGLSIHFQILSVIDESGISSKYLYIGKFLHGIISGIAAYIVFSFLPDSMFALGQYAASASFMYLSLSGKVLIYSLIAVSIIMLILILTSGKKHSGKAGRNNV